MTSAVTSTSERETFAPIFVSDGPGSGGKTETTGCYFSSAAWKACQSSRALSSQAELVTEPSSM